jgi:2-hydroxycyclohexanecarboxyl-CoA dehydrogenase
VSYLYRQQLVALDLESGYADVSSRQPAANSNDVLLGSSVDNFLYAAAIQVRTPIDSISDEEWQRHMAVNVGGAFHVMREVAPIMKRQGSGAICFTSGLVGLG